MKIKLLAALSIFMLLGAWFLSYSNTAQDKDSIHVGMMSGWAPFMTVNKKGEFEGFDVDIVKELARRLGKEYYITDMGALASLFVALETNKIDIILSGLDITQERLAKINMTAYCGDKLQDYWLLFWEEIPENIQKIEDLKDLDNPIVAVEPGVSAEKFLAHFDYIQKRQIASLSDRLLDLQYGKSLALLLEPAIARQLMAKKTELKALKVPLPVEFQIHGMGIASKKDNPVLREKLEAVIADMKLDGTLEKLQAKWQLNENGDEV